MEISHLIKNIIHSQDYDNQIVHNEVLEAKDPQYQEVDPPINGYLQDAIRKRGIEKLYTHQAEAIENIRNNKNTVVVTSTASGKTLCYNVPVIEAIIKDVNIKAMYMFPTKALAQDQKRNLEAILSENDKLKETIVTATYDGDTPNHLRKKIRTTANIILTNPDMLHQAILPHHTKWASFFQKMRYVILDELHVYRGIFGSHMANLMRRLERISNYYGNTPVYILCSATISNPVEHAELIINKKVYPVTNDGAPRGQKEFLLWNPPLIDRNFVLRKSPGHQAQLIMKKLILNNLQTITFSRTRLQAELIYRYLKEEFDAKAPEYSEKIKSYRSGYLPEERRGIEKKLFKGELLGVSATNALELGIDIGSLDASIIVGYPGTISSTWQQAGRAGRTNKKSLTIFIGGNDPLDQYFMKNPAYFFKSPVEKATIDPENPYILASHISSAAYELPITEADSVYFGKYTVEIVKLLEETGYIKKISDQWYWSQAEYPSARTNLRTVSDDTFSIVIKSERINIIGTMDSSSVPLFLHPGAVYFHQGEIYLVEELNYNQKYAQVERKDLNYYTRPGVNSKIKIQEKREEKVIKNYMVCYGDAEVTWEVVSFSKIRFHTHENFAVEKLELPPETIETSSFWLIPDKTEMDNFLKKGLNFVEGLVGLKNLLLTTLPVIAMCDKNDIGGVIDNTQFPVPSLFIYDKYKGGLGYTERGYGIFSILTEMCFRLVNGCECKSGCPSCVGAPDLRDSIYKDFDGKGRLLSPDKESTKTLLKNLLGTQQK